MSLDCLLGFFVCVLSYHLFHETCFRPLPLLIASHKIGFIFCSSKACDALALN